MTEVRFVSSNEQKIDEARSILSEYSIRLKPVSLKIEEVQAKDTCRLVRRKALDAFRQIERPLFVEHTSLALHQLNGLPGGLTQVFRDTLEADKFAKIFGQNGRSGATARTDLCFINGTRFPMFSGEVQGGIADRPRGDRRLHWDCVFIPEGFDRTFVELGTKKNEILMRRRALDSCAEFLKSELQHVR